MNLSQKLLNYLHGLRSIHGADFWLSCVVHITFFNIILTNYLKGDVWQLNFHEVQS